MSEEAPTFRGFLYILMAAFGFLAGCFSSRSATNEQVSMGFKDNETAGARVPANISIKAELHTPERVERQRQANEDRNYRMQRWLTWGTWAAVFAASIYAAINYSMLSEMRRSERPWLGIEGGISVDKKPFGAGRSQWTVSTKIWNYGASPATNVAISFGPGPPTGDFKTGGFWKTSTACKNSDDAHFNPNGALGVAFPHAEFSEGDWRPYASFNVPDNSFYVVVCITYTDSTKNIYHSKMLYSPDFTNYDLVGSDIQ